MNSAPDPADGFTIFDHMSDGNLDLVLEGIAGGADVNALSADGVTLLHLAAEYGSTIACKALLAGGADIDAAVITPRDDDEADGPIGLGQTPLQFAIASHQQGTGALLVKMGAKIDFVDACGNTLLHLCAKQKLTLCALALLDAGVELDRVNLDRRSPMHRAAASGALTLLNSLACRGANINATDAVGTSILHAAASSNEPRCTSALIDLGVDVNVTTPSGETPLHHAATLGRAEQVKLLLSRGSNVNARGTQQQTPVFMAATFGHLDICSDLIRAGSVTSPCPESPGLLEFCADRGYDHLLGPLSAVINEMAMRERMDSATPDIESPTPPRRRQHSL